jgi:3-phosphoglycerate kinase
MKVLNQFNFKDKRVLVRCDFNVPLDKEGNILDDFKIKQSLKTINYLKESGARIILMSHLGDPKGEMVKVLTMDTVKRRLEKLLGQKIIKSDDCVGKKTKETADKISNGEILLLENLRFHKEEEENNHDFAMELAGLGDIYVNEAFAVSHRAHASIVGIPNYLPSCAGFLFEKEIQVLSGLVGNPKKPLIVIIGGTKVETKSKLIEKFLEVADWVLVSGLIQKETNEQGLKFKNQEKVIFPVGDLAAFDINSESVKIFEEKIAVAKTIFWNGPFGMIEKEEFSKGTRALAEAIIKSGAFSVIGGGETTEFVNKLGLINKFSHVSTGGGAMLDFLVDGDLVGLDALGEGALGN